MIFRALLQALRALLCADLLRMLTLSWSVPSTLCVALVSVSGWWLGSSVRHQGYLICQGVRVLLLALALAVGAAWQVNPDLEPVVLAYVAFACGVMIGITPTSGGGRRSRTNTARAGLSLVRSLLTPQTRV